MTAMLKYPNKKTIFLTGPTQIEVFFKYNQPLHKKACLKNTKGCSTLLPP